MVSSIYSVSDASVPASSFRSDNLIVSSRSCCADISRFRRSFIASAFRSSSSSISPMMNCFCVIRRWYVSSYQTRYSLTSWKNSSETAKASVRVFSIVLFRPFSFSKCSVMTCSSAKDIVHPRASISLRNRACSSVGIFPVTVFCSIWQPPLFFPPFSGGNTSILENHRGSYHEDQ